MTKSKKPEKKPHEMTTDELAEKLFSKKVVEELKKIAHEKDNK